MTPHDKIGFLSKDTFMAMSSDEKWGVWFDYMVGNKADQKDRCIECREDFDGRYERKHSKMWVAGYLTVIGALSFAGGFIATWFGYTPKIGAK